MSVTTSRHFGHSNTVKLTIPLRPYRFQIRSGGVFWNIGLLELLESQDTMIRVHHSICEEKKTPSESQKAEIICLFKSYTLQLAKSKNFVWKAEALWGKNVPLQISVPAWCLSSQQGTKRNTGTDYVWQRFSQESADVAEVTWHLPVIPSLASLGTRAEKSLKITSVRNVGSFQPLRGSTKKLCRFRLCAERPAEGGACFVFIAQNLHTFHWCKSIRYRVT